MIIRVIISFILSANFTLIFYRDFFEASSENRILVFIWVLPCFHLLVSSFLFMTIVIGSDYRKHVNFSITKAASPYKIFRGISLGLQQIYFSVPIDDRERIVRGIFRHIPKTLITYRHANGKLKVLSIESLMIELVSILISILVAVVLRVLFLNLQQ